MALALVGSVVLGGGIAHKLLDRVYPPDLSRLQDLSHQIVDRNGRPLRTYLTRQGHYRRPATVEEVDRRYLKILVAYEDKRFWNHSGVDIWALMRAVGQAVLNGRIVSGASTLTMQTARLLEPRPRTLRSKVIEMWRALQLERRFNKDEILGMYLTLAPFGGNVEGVLAAAQAYFGRPAAHLTLAEAALLVALPRSPSRFRPDRHPGRAVMARNAVLNRAAPRLGLDAVAEARARAAPVPTRLRPQPFLAPHLADRLRPKVSMGATTTTTIDASLQRILENAAFERARSIGARASTAILVAESRSRQVLAYVASAAFGAEWREGQVDMIQAIRSPGSTLKPVIYGLAFDRGLAHPATLVNDVPTQFGDYAPANFMQEHMGQVSLADALRQSLNVPAVAVLERLGPSNFVERLRRDGIAMAFRDSGAVPGLAVALGGVGTTLEDLVRLYAAIGSDGRLKPLRYLADGAAASGHSPRSQVMRAPARWYIGEILRRMPPPGRQIADSYRRNPRHIAYKTGTSFGFRDAWAVGYDTAYTVGVWVGRADGAPMPGHYGANTAAPLLFRVFEQLPKPNAAPGARPAATSPMDAVDLPPGQRTLTSSLSLSPVESKAVLRIVYPLNKTRLQLPRANGALRLVAEGGKRPFTWFIDGAPLAARAWTRETQWRPEWPGFSDIVVVDAVGRQSKSRVRLITAD